MRSRNRARLRQHDRVEKFPPKVATFRKRLRGTSLPLVEVLAGWRPGSYDATGWDWDAEEVDIRARERKCESYDGGGWISPKGTLHVNECSTCRGSGKEDSDE